MVADALAMLERVRATLTGQSLLSGAVEVEPDRVVPIWINAPVAADQHELYELAVARASELTGTRDRGTNLAAIALDFVATNDFKFASEQQRIDFLAKFERLMPYLLVIVSRETGEIVHGIEALKRLMANDDEDES